MSCEKASKRLRCILGKARRLGLTKCDVADLPVAKKIISLQKNTNNTSSTSVIILVMCFIAGGLLLLTAMACRPCTDRRSVYHVHQST